MSDLAAMKAEAVERRDLGPAVVALRSRDLVELTKPGITGMVVLTAGIGFLLASAGTLDLRLLLATLVGTALVSGGASALNHVLERDIDARMRRTARRPLPDGRLDPERALVFAVVLAVVGLAELAATVNALTALLGAAALGGYVFVYTPLKRLSSLATVVGAVPGAIPPMMGWAAVRGGLGAPAWVLFGILFFWQLPHFLAIAWLCRGDYAAARLPMLTVLDPSGRRTARQMILYCAVLLPVSMAPTLLGLTGVAYLLGATLLGLAFLAFCVAFALTPTVRSARWLMLVSVLYLPAVLAVMICDRYLG